MLEHEEVARKKNAGGVIEDRQIVVCVRRRPRPQGKRTVPEVKAQFVGNKEAGGDDFDVRDQGLAKKPAEFIEVIPAVRGKRPWQVLVPGESDPFALEGGVPKNVIGVHVGVDHIPDRLAGH